MIKVGLTGSIGAGKSTVSGVFEVIGIPVYYADLEAKKILFLDQVQPQLRKDFPASVFGEDGLLLTKALAKYVFNHPDALNRLNSIIHPLVKQDFRKWVVEHQTSSYLIHEAAILIESGFYKEFDLVIAVTAPELLRISRVMERDHVTEAEVRDRMRNQWPDEEKIKFADRIIINDGAQSLIRQVIDIHQFIMSKQ